MNCDLDVIDGKVVFNGKILSICGKERFDNLKHLCNENELFFESKIINVLNDDIANECDSVVNEAKKNNSLIVVSYDAFEDNKRVIDYLDNCNVNSCSEYALQIYLEISQRKKSTNVIQLERFNKIYLRYSLTCKKLIKALESECIFVYQRSKVGSSTICKSLDMCGINNIHIHQLNFMKPYKYLDYRLPKCVGNIDLFNGSSEFTNGLFETLKNKSKIKIITCIRDPLARDFSEFFQSLEWPAFELDRIAGENLSFLEACKSYIKHTSSISQEDWFDNELKHIFDIDIFSYPFDKEKGYSVIKKENIEVLVIKLEKMNSLEHIISIFLGEPSFKLINANTNDAKISKMLYDTVKEKIMFTNEELDKYYSNNSRLHHFYTADEFSTFRSKWNVWSGRT